MKKLSKILLLFVLLTPLFGYSQVDTNKRYGVHNITVIGDSLYCTDSAGLLTLANLKLQYGKNTKALIALEDMYLISQIDVQEYHQFKKSIKSNQKMIKRKIFRQNLMYGLKGFGIGVVTTSVGVIILLSL